MCDAGLCCVRAAAFDGVLPACVVSVPPIHPCRCSHSNAAADITATGAQLLLLSPHPPRHLQGEGIYSFVTLRKGVAYSAAIEKELIATVRKAIGAIATPDAIHVTPDLPKTRSGKIMRRILRKVAAGETDTSTFGDISTLADPAVVEALVKSRSDFVKK